MGSLERRARRLEEEEAELRERARQIGRSACLRWRSGA
jgi:hypothetical protein